MILGYRIKELRKGKNLSQEQLGKLIGVTKVSVSGYENGSRVPSLDVLQSLIDTFQVSADYLLGREVNVVCENDDNVQLTLALSDIEIIREIRRRPTLYNKIGNNPKRFFATLYKNNL